MVFSGGTGPGRFIPDHEVNTGGVSVKLTPSEIAALRTVWAAADIRADQWREAADCADDQSLDPFELVKELFEAGRDECESMCDLTRSALDTVQAVINRFERESGRLHDRYGDKYKRYE